MHGDVPWSVRNEACSQGQRVRDGEDGGSHIRNSSETCTKREAQRGSIIAPGLHVSCSARDAEADERDLVAPADCSGTNGEDYWQVVVKKSSSTGVVGFVAEHQQPGRACRGGSGVTSGTWSRASW